MDLLLHLCPGDMIAPPQCTLPFVTCEDNGDAAPPDIRQWTDGTARHGMLVIMYIDSRTLRKYNLDSTVLRGVL